MWVGFFQVDVKTAEIKIAHVNVRVVVDLRENVLVNVQIVDVWIVDAVMMIMHTEVTMMIKNY